MVKKAAKKVKKKTTKKRTSKPRPEPSPTGENRGAKHANSGSFKKGQSGNPGGRPKGIGITQHMLKMVLEVAPGANTSKAEDIAKVIVDGACKGDKYFVGVVLDRIDGPVATVIESEGGILGSDLTGKRLVIEQTVVEPNK